VETVLEAKATNRNSRLQLSTTTKGVVWLDQVSAMPLDTYKVGLYLEFDYFYQIR
jgi:alpha-N-arabinofuranosidase